MVRLSFQRVPSAYGPSVSIWMESMPESVAAEPGMSEMTAHTLSAGALMCCVRLVLWSMASSLARRSGQFSSPRRAGEQPQD